MQTRPGVQAEDVVRREEEPQADRVGQPVAAVDLPVCSRAGCLLDPLLDGIRNK